MNNVAIIADDRFTHHLTGLGHPERPSRYLAIINALEKAQLKTKENSIIPRSATEEEILYCHTKEYLELVKAEVELCKNSKVQTGELMLSTGDAQICPDSYEIAKLAVGATLNGVDSVLGNSFSSAFCVVRPPGHHACSNAGMGFCIFNNIAIGARYAQKKYGVERVLIADWDIHHGNGTQEIFEDDPSVFYFSTHRSPFYPGTGLKNEHGIGPGVGTTLNVPIDANSNDRVEILKAFKIDLVDAMKKFKPNLVMISAGFDAHYLDPLGGFHLQSDDYAKLTEILKQIADEHCNGKIVSVLEGGYSLQALAECAVAHVKHL